MNFIEFWINIKKKIDYSVNSFLSKINEWELLEVSKYILKDGKRFRSTLLLYFSEMLGSDFERSLDAALAVEILHSASLALDDIVDYDLERRNMPSAWTVFGNKKVIYVTNYLIPYALELISNYGEDAVKLSLELWKATALGALRELIGNPEDYLMVIELKTGSLFKLSTVLSAISVEKRDYVNIMEKIGRHLGIIYQIVDDYIDIIKFKNNEIESLKGSAKQLYDFKGEGYREFTLEIIELEKNKYYNLIEKLPIPEEKRKDAYSIPEVLISGLIAEAKIEKL